MALALWRSVMDLQPPAAHRRTSAYPSPSVFASGGSGKPISLRRLLEQRSKLGRFSRHICSSQCHSCQRLKVGQSSFVIDEGLCVFELQVEEVCEIREDMDELLAIGSIGAQRCAISRIGLRNEAFPIFLE